MTHHPATPEGWVMVPKEPTETMLKAGFGAFLGAHDPMFSANEPCGPIYKVMVLSAPPYTSGWEPITEDQLRADIRVRCDAHGSISAWASAVGLHDEQVRLFLSGKRPPEPKLLAAINMRRHVTYAFTAPAQSNADRALLDAPPAPSGGEENVHALADPKKDKTMTNPSLKAAVERVRAFANVCDMGSGDGRAHTSHTDHIIESDDLRAILSALDEARELLRPFAAFSPDEPRGAQPVRLSDHEFRRAAELWRKLGGEG